MLVAEKIYLYIILTILFIVSFSCNVSAGKIQLVAIQMKLELNDFHSRERYEEKIKNLMGQVADKITPEIPALVVFPEDVGLMLIAQGNEATLNSVETIEEAIKKMTMKYFFPVLWQRLKYSISWVPALYYHHHRIIAGTYFETFSMLAKKYQVYIVAGSVPLPHYQFNNGQALYQEEPLGPEIYNSSYLFGPDGKVIGYQDKVHLLELEQEEGLHLTPGKIEDIKVFPTDVGRLGIAICLDGFKEDVIGKLREQQADILIQPSANPKPWDKEQQEDWLTGSYQYTYQLNYFKYAINPMMNGEFFNLSFYGQSSIITGGEDGFVKNFKELQPQKGFMLISDSDNREEIMMVEVEL
jgi:predicted amidohydrolase